MPHHLKQHAVGEHVRRLRHQAGMSVRKLARESGFSPSFMSQVENGQVSPSISSMEKIATAVGVTLGDFFAAVSGADGGLIVRVGERQALSSGWSAAEIEALSVPGPRVRLEALLITLRPGGRSGKHPYAHDREEFAFVTRGEVMLTLGPEEHRLRRGDAATIRPGELRLWRNAAKAPVQILIIASSAGAAPDRRPRPRAAVRGGPPATASRRSGRRGAR